MSSQDQNDQQQLIVDAAAVVVPSNNNNNNQPQGKKYYQNKKSTADSNANDGSSSSPPGNKKETNKPEIKSVDKDEKKEEKKKAAAAAAPPAAATHVAVHFALASRIPKENGGGIMSVAAVCFNADTRTIVDTFERNVLPSIDPARDDFLSKSATLGTGTSSSAVGESPEQPSEQELLQSHRQSFVVGKNVSFSFANIMSADTIGYWGSSSRRKEYRAVTENPVHPRDMMKDLHDFCKKHGGSRITLVCNPLGAFFSFILHYQELYLNPLKEYQSPPWGFGAMCVRSYCSGVLGVPMSQVATNKKYVDEFCEGFDPNQTLQPIASAVVAAIAFIHASSTASAAAAVTSEAVKNANDNDDEGDVAAQAEKSKCVKWSCAIPAAAAKGYLIPDPVVDIFRMPYVAPAAENNNNKNSKKTQPQQKETVPAASSSSLPQKNPPQLLLYPSITDADFSVEDVEKTIAHWAKVEHPNIDWIVQEKVHGSNLSIAMDPISGEVYAARRESPLSIKDASAFYCFDYLIQDIRSELSQIVEKIKNTFSGSGDKKSNDLILVQFFGEICGGDYDEKNGVAPVIGASRVQRGVMYAPWHCFYVFDCVVHFQAQNEQVARYLSYDELDEFFTSSASSNLNNNSMKQLLLAPVMARGTFEELNKNFPCEFDSKFPSWVGLPHRQNSSVATAAAVGATNNNNNNNNTIIKSGKTTNFAEGIILRPVREGDNEDAQRLYPLALLAKSTSSPQKQQQQEKDKNSSKNNGNDQQQQTEENTRSPSSYYYYRPLVKKKHPMFREFVSSQQIFDKIPTCELFSRLVTVARVASVISKMTKTERDNEGKVVSSMVADIIKDIKEIIKNKNKSVQASGGEAEVFDEKADSQDPKNLNLVSTAVRSYFGSGGN